MNITESIKFRSYKKDWGFGKKLGNWIRIIIKPFTKMVFLFVKPKLLIDSEKGQYLKY